jgi:hypothetical protein
MFGLVCACWVPCISLFALKRQKPKNGMKTINQSSRRQFIKAGGILIAASGLAAAVNAFAKEEEKQNVEVSPPEDLMREHGVLKRILLIYGEAIRRIEADQDLPPEPVAESAKIIRQFVEDYHENWKKISFSRVSKKRTNLSILSMCCCNNIRRDDT